MADLIADDIGSWSWPPDVKARMDQWGKAPPPAPEPEAAQPPCDVEPEDSAFDMEMYALLNGAHC